MNSNRTPTTRRKTKRRVTKRDPDTVVPATLKLTAEQIEIAELRTEVMRLNKFADDLQERFYVNCAYCGHRFGPRHATKSMMTDVIKQHVRQCKRHPLFKALRALEEYGRHQPHCKQLNLKGECTCGFTAALETA